LSTATGGIYFLQGNNKLDCRDVQKRVNWGFENYWKPQIPEDYAADLVSKS
jgi:hypothetical protein